MKQGCKVALLFALGLPITLIVLFVGFTAFNAANPQPTPFPITRYCIDESLPRTHVSLILAEAVRTDDIEILNSATYRPTDEDSESYSKNVQIHAIQFSAYKKGTGKYKKGWLYVHMKDQDCSVFYHDLHW